MEGSQRLRLLGDALRDDGSAEDLHDRLRRLVPAWVDAIVIERRSRAAGDGGVEAALLELGLRHVVTATLPGRDAVGGRVLVATRTRELDADDQALTDLLAWGVASSVRDEPTVSDVVAALPFPVAIVQPAGARAPTVLAANDALRAVAPPLAGDRLSADELLELQADPRVDTVAISERPDTAWLLFTASGEPACLRADGLERSLDAALARGRTVLVAAFGHARVRSLAGAGLLPSDLVGLAADGELVAAVVDDDRSAGGDRFDRMIELLQPRSFGCAEPEPGGEERARELIARAASAVRSR